MPESWQRWYPHDINDWNGSAAVRAFSDAAYRAYHTLLMAQFEQDDGMLPNDPRKLAKLSGMGLRWLEPRAGYPTISEEVMEEFESGPDGKVYNPRMYKEWLRAREVFEKRSNGGKRKSLPRVIEESSKSLGTVVPGNTENPEQSTTHIQGQIQKQNTNTPPSRAQDTAPEPPSLEEPAWGCDDPPPGLHGMQYAAWLLERRNIPAVPATLRSGSAAIETASRKYGKPPNEAVVLLDSLAAQAQARGQPVNKFWLEDPDKWEAKEATSAANPANRHAKTGGNLNALAEFARRRGIDLRRANEIGGGEAGGDHRHDSGGLHGNAEILPP